MGARHPEAVLAQLGANKNEFILAAKHLIRMGVVNSHGDAIRYMEEHNTDVQQVLEELITSQQTKIIKETEDDDTSGQSQQTEQ